MPTEQIALFPRNEEAAETAAPATPDPAGAAPEPEPGAAPAAPAGRRARRSARPRLETDAADLLFRRSLPLTAPAPNWAAWCGRPLRLEVETPQAWASLPMAMEIRDASCPPIPHGCFSGCELSRGLYWLAESDLAHGAMLVPRGHFWVRDGKGGRSEDRGLPAVRLRVAAEDGFYRLGPCPPEAAAIARRLHRKPVPGRWLDETEDVAEQDVDALLGVLVEARLAVSAGLGPMFPDAVGQHDVASRPFRVETGWCRDGRVRIDGAMAIACEATHERIRGVRVTESVLGAEILIDLWRNGEGFGPTWRLLFANMPPGAKEADGG